MKTLFTLVHGNALLTKLGCSSHAALEVLVSLRTSTQMQDGHVANEKVPRMDQSDVMCTSSHYGRQRVCVSGWCCTDDGLLEHEKEGYLVDKKMSAVKKTALWSLRSSFGTFTKSLATGMGLLQVVFPFKSW